MSQQKSGNVTNCPECDGSIQLSGKLHVGQKLSCRRCGSTLVITEREPLELVLANDKRPGNGHDKAEKKRTKDKVVTQSSHEKIGENKEDPPMSTLSQVSMSDCPECQARLRFYKPLKVGHLVVCPECEETLEVVSSRPLEFNWADEDPWDIKDHDDHRHHSRDEIS